MGVEIERKFLVRVLPPPDQVVDIQHIKQGYLINQTDRTVRVRQMSAMGRGSQSFITIKSGTTGITRQEDEFTIDPLLGNALIRQCGKTIDKTRYVVQHQGHRWDVDIFHGSLKGLMLAEVELHAEDENIIIPEWVGREVSGEPEYFNSSLIDRLWIQNPLDVVRV